MKSDPIEAVSAGGVVYDLMPHGLQFIVCRRHSSDLWALPKGTPHDGETKMQTAVREVCEETGLEVEIETDLGFIEYSFERSSQLYHKRVYFFLMKAIGGSVDNHDHEFDEIHWLGNTEFLDALTHLSERGIASKAISTLLMRKNNE